MKASLIKLIKSLDIILVDDGSSDESLQIALEFAQIDERIFVISKPNGGQSLARNFGLEFMRGTMLRKWIEGRWNGGIKILEGRGLPLVALRKEKGELSKKI